MAGAVVVVVCYVDGVGGGGVNVVWGADQGMPGFGDVRYRYCSLDLILSKTFGI